MKTKKVTDYDQQREWKALERHKEPWYIAQRAAIGPSRAFKAPPKVLPWMLNAMVQHERMFR